MTGVGDQEEEEDDEGVGVGVVVGVVVGDDEVVVGVVDVGEV